jgi:hypothetical protein
MLGIVIGVLAVGLVVGLFVASVSLRRYRDTDRAAPGWRATDEVFSDPSTKRIMRVWLDDTGNRHYVTERSSDQSP